MTEKDEEKKEARKKMEKEAIEDIKPNKGSPDSLTEGEPGIEDVKKKAGKKDKEDERKRH